MKIIFFGSSEFSIPFLKAVHESRHNIVLIVTGIEKQKGRGKKILPNPVKESAELLGLPVLEVDDFNDEIVEIIEKKSFDCSVLVSFGKILPEKLINIPDRKTINLHPSYLPKYRGPSPIISALLEGDAKTGISLIKMTEEIDAGDAYLISEFAIADDDNRDSLEEKIAKIGAPLLVSIMDLIEENKIAAFPQGNNNISYTKIFSKNDLKVDWNRSAVEIRNKIRAFSSKPGCFTNWKEKKIKILKTSICNDEKLKKLLKDEYRNGTVICADKNGLFIKCGAKEKYNKFLSGEIIKIETLKPQNKNNMSFLDFINGYRIKPGDFFE